MTTAVGVILSNKNHRGERIVTEIRLYAFAGVVMVLHGYNFLESLSVTDNNLIGGDGRSGHLLLGLLDKHVAFGTGITSPQLADIPVKPNIANVAKTCACLPCSFVGSKVPKVPAAFI